jgi:hypothetical protein
MAKKCILRLSEEKRALLVALVSKGRASAQKIRYKEAGPRLALLH